MKQIKTYDCGVRLIHEYFPERKTAKIAFFVASGSGFDLKNKEGIAHYFEHMFFKSTKNRSAKKILEEIDYLGGNHNAFTSFDKTCYYGTVIADDAEKFFEMLSDCFFNGLFLENEMETEKGVVCSEIDKYEDEFMDCCADALQNKMFEGTNFAHPILGSKKTVMSVTPDDLREYRTNNNGPGKLIVSIFGGVTFEKADELVKKYVLPNFTVKEEPVIYKNFNIFTPSNQNSLITTTKDTKQVYFIDAKPTIRYGDGVDFLKLKIANSMFGGSISSRLFDRMREKEGIVYYASSYLSTLPISGTYNAAFITDKNSAEKAVKAYFEEIQKVLDNGFTEKEFQNALHMYKSEVLMREDNIDLKAHMEASTYLYTGQLYDVDEDLKELECLDLDDVNKTFINTLKQNSVYSIVMKDNDENILKLLK